VPYGSNRIRGVVVVTADLVIKGGTVVDGSGGPGRLADVAITGDRVTAIGSGLTGNDVLDATGHVVAPGFIDNHTHFDAQVFWDPALTPSCFHGVTTVVAGNCGFSIAPCRPEHREFIARTLEQVEDMDFTALSAGIPWEFESFPEYLAAVRRRGVVLNYGVYVGHTAIRLFVMGDDFERAANDAEVGRMREVLTEAMEAGALGFASSRLPTHNGAYGKPIPSRYAEESEMETLAEVLGELDRGVLMIAPGNYPLESLYALSNRVGRPLTWTALATDPSGRYRKRAEFHSAQHRNGADVWPQVTPRPIVFQVVLNAPFPLNVGPRFAALVGRPSTDRMAAYSDPEWRRAAAEELDTATDRPRPRWDTFTVAESLRHPDLVGRNLSQLASDRGVHPIDIMCELAVDDELETRINCTLANDDPDGIAFLLNLPGTILGLSDAGAHVRQICDAAQATELLGTWVRERGVLSVEQAVRKLSGEQADLLRLTDRGYLREGAFADVVVFDPTTVAPGPTKRLYDFPGGSERLTADQPSGIAHVLVNGVPIRRDGTQLEQADAGRPGMLI